MSRWHKALIAASVGVAASAALLVTSSTPGQAEASLVANYRCTGGIAGAGVDLEARMTPQVEAGGQMYVRWDMSYKTDGREFGSPGFFPKGSSLALEGTVDISGAWNGRLLPRGSKDQPELVPGQYLELPEGLSDQGSIKRSGKVRFKPGALFVRFTPAKGEVMVNNKTDVEYTGGWEWEYTQEQYNDHLNDVQKTSTHGEVAKLQFIGTQVAYIGRRAPGLGPIRVLLDGHPVTDPLVELGKDRSGKPVIGTETQVVLWESPKLDYGPHTIEIVNVEDKPAYLDAFKVTTGEVGEPPIYNQATCTLLGDPGAIDVTIPGSTPTNSPSPTPTDSPTVTPPTDNTPTNSPSPTPTATNTTPNGGSNDGGLGHVIVMPSATGTSSGSATPKTTGPTATKYYKAQVAKTPKGGVDSGEAPDRETRPYGLMAALVMAGGGGGLLLRRRRAAHAGGVL
ncbi:hypothetical protein [Nonomuraea sp. NPDC049695]|uniref:hypothetical protein n=1 Tax=Nonomuraea sp. NPDC049695 TaxID=3154734 RepID=UPI003438506D